MFLEEKDKKKERQSKHKQSSPPLEMEESKAALPSSSTHFGWLSSGLGLLTIDAIEAIFTACISIRLKGHSFRI